METPFIYNRPVDNQNFVGYDDLSEHIAGNILQMRHTIVLGARKTGKTSLLDSVAARVHSERSDYIICHVDIKDADDKENILAILADGIIRTISEDLREAAENVRTFLPGIDPRIEVRSGESGKFALTFNNSDVAAAMKKFMDLPETVAAGKGKKIMIVVDNFEKVLELSDCEEFICELEGTVSGYRSVVCCFCANKRHMMSELLRHSKLGEIISMIKPSEKKLAEYISSIFSQTAKYIDEDTTGLIVSLVEGHPYYVQQLAQISWLHTYVVCTREIVLQSHRAMVDQSSMVFEDLTGMFTSQQICYLRAIVAGEQVISTTDILHKYGITSATSASRSKSALLQKGIIDVNEGKTYVINPLFAFWLKSQKKTVPLSNK